MTSCSRAPAGSVMTSGSDPPMVISPAATMIPMRTSIVLTTVSGGIGAAGGPPGPESTTGRGGSTCATGDPGGAGAVSGWLGLQDATATAAAAAAISTELRRGITRDNSRT